MTPPSAIMSAKSRSPSSPFENRKAKRYCPHGSALTTSTGSYGKIGSLIDIGSRNALHRDHCIAAFERGRHVFCEKPLAVTLSECEQIQRAHQRAGTLFATGFVLRHAPLYKFVREQLRSGVIGKLVSFEANEHIPPDHGGYIMRGWRRWRAQAGSHLLEKCSHDIDLLNWMTDSVPARVASFGGRSIWTAENKPIAEKLSRPTDNPPLYRAWPIYTDADPFLTEKDIEDHRVCIFEYRNGVRGTFHANTCAALPQRRMLFYGLEGALEADLVTAQVRWARIGRGEQPQTKSFKGVDMHGGADCFIMDDLAHSMTTGAAPGATGNEGLRSAVSCLACDLAMDEQRVVDVEPIWERLGV